MDPDKAKIPDGHPGSSGGLPTERRGALSADICVLGRRPIGGEFSAAARSGPVSAARVALVDGLPRARRGKPSIPSSARSAGLFANGQHGAQFTHGIADDILARARPRRGALHYPPRRARRTRPVVMYDEIALSPLDRGGPSATPISPCCSARSCAGVARDGTRIRELDLATRYGGREALGSGICRRDRRCPPLTWEAGILPAREALPMDRSTATQMDGARGDRRKRRQPTRAELTARARAKAALYGFGGVPTEFCVRLPRPRHGAGEPHPCRDPRSTPVAALQEMPLLGKGGRPTRSCISSKKRISRCLWGRRGVRSYGLCPAFGRTRLDRRSPAAHGRRCGAPGRHSPTPIARHRLADRAARSCRRATSGRPFSDDHVHYVPFGSLVPAEADNIVAAGPLHRTATTPRLSRRAGDGDRASRWGGRGPRRNAPRPCRQRQACSRSISRALRPARCGTMSNARIRAASHAGFGRLGALTASSFRREARKAPVGAT